MQDRNSIIGIILLTILFFVWVQMSQPSKEELEAQKKQQEAAQHTKDSLENAAKITATLPDSTQKTTTSAPVVTTNQSAKAIVIENDLMKVTFNSLGGRIQAVELKKYTKLTGESGKETHVPVQLLEDTKNKWEFNIPLNNSILNTGGVVFEPTVQGNKINFKYSVGADKYVEQTYSVKDGSYQIDYQNNIVGLGQDIKQDAKTVELVWENYLDKLEKNADYERNYSTVYYKPSEKNVDYCECTKNDADNVNLPLKWVANSNQFFNTSLIAESAFTSADLSTEMFDNSQPDLKKIRNVIRLPYNHSPNEQFKMTMFVGPNEYDLLKGYNVALEDQISFGTSILGTINRWIIRPVFAVIHKFVPSEGIVILLLTLIVKLLLIPLTYKMVYSQSKMTSLKPQIDKLKHKYGEDQQKLQMETMKIYQEYGVNPLGGCLPMLLQMPIWLALYRFFPASIEFRQASFLWAPDLSTFDEWIRFGVNVPGFGKHLSLFALLWLITTLLYTWYNSRNMDFSSNPMMKYLQYIMPVTFIFFFNSFASGLSAYLCFSNILNIGQTFAIKYLLIDQNKIQAELEKHKNNPNKKKGFTARLEEAMKQQQKLQEERNKKKQ